MDEGEEEMELINSISKIVKLKEEAPSVDTKGVLNLIFMQVDKYNHKDQRMINVRVAQKSPVIIDQNKINIIDDISLGKPSKRFIKKEQKNIKPSMETLADPRIDHVAEHKHAYSKYDNNPWGVKVNHWAVCEKCGKLGVLGIAVYPHDNRTYVYKQIEHHMPGDLHKQSCYETLERFNGKHKYEELAKLKGLKKK